MSKFYSLKKFNFLYIFLISSLIILLLPALGAAQINRNLIYPEIATALLVKVPNKVYKDKQEIIDYLIAEVARRKVDSPLTEDIEQLLRDSGADDRLIRTIKANVTTNLKHISAAFYSNRAVYFSSRGFKDQALNDYQRALDLDPDFTNAYSNRGDYYLGKGENDKAIEDFSKYIEITNRRNFKNSYTNKYFVFEGYYNRGRAYMNKKEYEMAVRDFTKFIELSTNFDANIINESYSAVATAFFNRAYSYSEIGQNDAAISDYTKYISVKPDDSTAYSNRGVAYEQKADYQSAIKDFRKALQVDPNNEYAKRNLERVLSMAR